jgi:hypothetical protein
MLRVILLDGLVPLKNELTPKYKRPVEFIVSSIRMLNAETDAGKPLDEYLVQMGQPPYQWPTPDGPPVAAAEWQGNLLPRWKFAISLARNQIEGTEIDIESIALATGSGTIETFIENISPLVLGTALNRQDSSQLAKELRNAGAGDDEQTGRIITAGLLAAPAFQWK